MKKKISWGMLVVTILFVGYLAVQTSQSAPAPEQNLFVPQVITTESATLPLGFATLEPAATERLESSAIDSWFHAWGPVLAIGLVLMMLFGSNMSYITRLK